MITSEPPAKKLCEEVIDILVDRLVHPNLHPSDKAPSLTVAKTLLTHVSVTVATKHQGALGGTKLGQYVTKTKTPDALECVTLTLDVPAMLTGSRALLEIYKERLVRQMEDIQTKIATTNLILQNVDKTTTKESEVPV